MKKFWHNDDLLQIDWLQKHLEGNFGDAIIPFVYPIPEDGSEGVQFEWDIGPYRASLDIYTATRIGEWHCLNLDTSEDDARDLQLTRKKDWAWLVENLNEL